MIVADPRGLICGCNSAAGQLFGYPSEELHGRSIFQLLAMDHDSREPCEVQSERRVVVRHKDGRAVLAWMRAARVGVGDQERFRFVFEDEKSRSNHRRLHSENQTLRTALDATGFAVALLDPQGRVIRLSRTCADLLEVSVSHVEARLFWELSHRQEDWNSIRSAFEQARSGQATTLCKIQWISRTQRSIPIEWLLLKPSFDRSGELVHVIAIAAPAAERAGEPGQQHDLKIIARVVGRLAGHLENLLSTINGYSELVLHEMAASNPLRKDVEQIFAAGQSASRSMHQLLTFSGNRLLLLEPLDLNALITQITQVTSPSNDRVTGRLRADLALCTGSTLVLGNREAFEEVLLTLAEYSGERLTIATESTRIRQTRSTIAGNLDPGDYVTLKVALGKMLGPEALAHLFEPFHPASHAPGQSPAGMAMVHGIIRSCGGGISLSEDDGTTLEIWLPSAMGVNREKVPADKKATAAQV